MMMKTAKLTAKPVMTGEELDWSLKKSSWNDKTQNNINRQLDSSYLKLKL